MFCDEGACAMFATYPPIFIGKTIYIVYGWIDSRQLRQVWISEINDPTGINLSAYYPHSRLLVIAVLGPNSKRVLPSKVCSPCRIFTHGPSRRSSSSPFPHFHSSMLCGQGVYATGMSKVTLDATSDGMCNGQPLFLPM